MKKNQFITIISALLILLGLTLGFLVYSVLDVVTADNYTNEYSYTKAICDDETCQDYIITCNGTKLIEQEPITGAFMNIPNGWEDPRPQELIDGFCNLSDF